MVYFIWDSVDAVKIGTSTNVAARFATLSTASARPLFLLGCTPGGREVEARLHAKFADERLNGEWFRATSRLMVHVRGLLSRKSCDMQPETQARPAQPGYLPSDVLRSKEDCDQFQPDAIVRHREYGSGNIVAVDGEWPYSLKATIDFGRLGVKKFVVARSDIEVVLPAPSMRSAI